LPRLVRATLALSVCCSLTAVLYAQPRFAIVGDDFLPSLGGLRILTIRDNAIGHCTLLFVVDAASAAGSSLSAARSAPSVEPPPQEVATARDNRLAELRAAMEAASNPLAAGIPTPNPSAFDWEAQKANTEYLVAALSSALSRLEARLEAVAQPLQMVSAAPGPCPAASTSSVGPQR
jgi:hypothetical protein